MSDDIYNIIDNLIFLIENLEKVNFNDKDSLKSFLKTNVLLSPKLISKESLKQVIQALPDSINYNEVLDSLLLNKDKAEKICSSNEALSFQNLISIIQLKLRDDALRQTLPIIIEMVHSPLYTLDINDASSVHNFLKFLQDGFSAGILSNAIHDENAKELSDYLPNVDDAIDYIAMLGALMKVRDVARILGIEEGLKILNSLINIVHFKVDKLEEPFIEELLSSEDNSDSANFDFPPPSLSRQKPFWNAPNASLGVNQSESVFNKYQGLLPTPESLEKYTSYDKSLNKNVATVRVLLPENAAVDLQKKDKSFRESIGIISLKTVRKQRTDLKYSANEDEPIEAREWTITFDTKAYANWYNAKGSLEHEDKIWLRDTKKPKKS